MNRLNQIILDLSVAWGTYLLTSKSLPEVADMYEHRTLILEKELLHFMNISKVIRRGYKK